MGEKTIRKREVKKKKADKNIDKKPVASIATIVTANKPKEV